MGHIFWMQSISILTGSEASCNEIVNMHSQPPCFWMRTGWEFKASILSNFGSTSRMGPKNLYLILMPEV